MVGVALVRLPTWHPCCTVSDQQGCQIPSPQKLATLAPLLSRFRQQGRQLPTPKSWRPWRPCSQTTVPSGITAPRGMQMMPSRMWYMPFGPSASCLLVAVHELHPAADAAVLVEDRPLDHRAVADVQVRPAGAARSRARSASVSNVVRADHHRVADRCSPTRCGCARRSGSARCRVPRRSRSRRRPGSASASPR